MDKEALLFIKDLENKLGSKLTWRSFATWFGSSRGIIREYGVFLCATEDSFYFEDFEHTPKLFGFIVTQKNKSEYVKYSRTVAISEIKSISRVLKRGADKNIKLLSNTLVREPNIILRAFSRCVTQLELHSGEILYFELINHKEFLNKYKELKDGRI